jgi:polysaccharide chain length determinant protein (PEP-CTERM system associated)
MKDHMRFYWRMALRRLPVMMALVILASSIGVVMALRKAPIYEGNARLLVEAPQISETLAEVTVTTSANEEITIIRERLMTRANLIEIAADFDVFENHSELSPDRIVDLMQKRTTIQSEGGRDQATVISVAFEARTGEIAASVVNEYVTRIMEANVQLRTARAGNTLDFFEQEVERLSAELGERSAAITRFQAENTDALPSDQNFRLSRQAVLQERIAAAQRDLSSLIDQRVQVVAVYDATGRVTATEDMLTDDQRLLRDLENQLAERLSVYSRDAPQIVALERRIDVLRSRVAAPGQEPQEAIDPNRAVLELQLRQIDNQISVLEDVVAEAQAELLELEDSINRAPLNAITLASLERDYENVRQQYDGAVARLAQASTGERIEMTSRGQRITLIESASVPQDPVRPNRRLIAAAGVFLGLALAGGLFVLLEIFNHKVRRPVEMARVIGIEPLATIPYITTRAQRLTQIFLRTAALLLVLVGLPAGLWAIDSYFVPLDQLATDILARFGLA